MFAMGMISGIALTAFFELVILIGAGIAKYMKNRKG